MAARQQFADDLLVAIEALGLVEGSFIRLEACPLQAFQYLLDCGGRRTLEIRVFDAQHELSRMAARVQPRKKRSAKSADVQEAGRTRSKSRADDHRLGKLENKRALSVAETPGCGSVRWHEPANRPRVRAAASGLAPTP